MATNENDDKLKKTIDLIQGAKAQHTEEFAFPLFRDARIAFWE